MQDILIRVESESYEAWLAVHNEHIEGRRAHGIIDGPVYRDIENPNAALFHIRAESLEQAMAWVGSDTFREATRRATVTGREFYDAQRREQPAAPAGR
jgi:heme-degrading monooxygenase HmoA